MTAGNVVLTAETIILSMIRRRSLNFNLIRGKFGNGAEGS